MKRLPIYRIFALLFIPLTIVASQVKLLWVISAMFGVILTTAGKPPVSVAIAPTTTPFPHLRKLFHQCSSTLNVEFGPRGIHNSLSPLTGSVDLCANYASAAHQ